MRLDAFISKNSDYSRTDIQRLIKQDCVRVNDQIITRGATHIKPSDCVRVNDTIVLEAKPRYLMLHKPLDYVCANSDSDHPTVLDLIDLPQKSLLQIAGRLDLDTTGLVLITDDGQWNHRVTSPKKLCEKCYLVTTEDPIDKNSVEIFKEGVVLRGEDKPTLPATLTITGSHTAELIICEGKYHQVKRMFAATGNKVIELHRRSIGNVILDNDLPEGNYRHLTSHEISFF